MGGGGGGLISRRSYKQNKKKCFGRMRYNVHVSEKQIKPGPAKQFRVGMAKIGLSAKGMSILGGSKGMLPREIF